MTPRSLRCLAAAALGLCAARPAHADAITDLTNGTTIFVQYARAELDGDSSNEAGIVIPKPGGTLQFSVPASAFGISLPITLAVNGIPLGNDRVQFMVSGAYSPGVDVTGHGDLLTGASGSVTVTAYVMPGADGPQCNHSACPGNVRLEVTSGTVVAIGTWGSKSIKIDEGRGVGGVTRPTVAGIWPPPPGLDSNGLWDLPFCSGPGNTTAWFSVALASPAPTGGSRIDFTWPHNGGLSFRNNLELGDGRDSVEVPMTVPPNFVGTVQVSAAAGGASTSTTLTVHPASDCEPPASKPVYEAYVPPWLVGCEACSLFADLNDDGGQITDLNGAAAFLYNNTFTPLAKAFPQASWAGADSINDTGVIAGRITIGGVTQAYRADMLHGAHQPQLLGAMTPTAINAGGALVGYRLDATTGLSVSVYDLGVGVVDLPLHSALGIAASRAVAVNTNGQIVGTYTDATGVVRGYRWVNGTTYTLPAVGVSSALPIAINDSNVIAANGIQGDQPVAALIANASNITLLGTPAGFVSFVVTSLNRWGWAVGVATNVNGVERAFLWKPGLGFVALTNYVKGLTAETALRITDGNQVVVHGTANGVTDLYLITL